MHCRDHIDAINNVLPRTHSWFAQGDMQHGAVLGRVDLLTGEHRIAAGRHAAFIGERQQQLHGLRVDALLGVVERPATGLGMELRETTRVVLEELSHR